VVNLKKEARLSLALGVLAVATFLTPVVVPLEDRRIAEALATHLVAHVGSGPLEFAA
jgi:hypothetical protein